MGCPKITYKPKLEVIQNEKLEIRNHPKFLISHSQFLIEEVHMNGRIYDPVLRSFMSPDPFIQAPDNSQNYNRYAYCLNNPLLYTDPSGNIFALPFLASAAIIGAFIGGVSYTAMAFYSGTFEWGGLAKNIIIGAASGAAGGGVAQAISVANVPMAGFWAASIGGALGGATYGTLNTILNGADPNGIWKGALSGFAGGGVGAYIGGNGGAIAGGFTAGGLGSALDGGDIGDIALGGAIGGAMSFALYKFSQWDAWKQYNKSEKVFGDLTRKAFNTISTATQRSMARNREVGGNLFIDSNGKVSVGKLYWGKSDGIEFSTENGSIGRWHTHPNDWGLLDTYSPKDIQTANSRKEFPSVFNNEKSVDSFVISPKNIFKYNADSFNYIKTLDAYSAFFNNSTSVYRETILNHSFIYSNQGFSHQFIHY